MRLDKKKILGSCLENCVHVAGILNFFQIAEEVGYKTKFLGPAIPILKIIKKIQSSDAMFIALSYRLTPDTGEKYINKFIESVKAAGITDRIYYFGGLPELVKRIKKYSFFKAYFTGGETIDDIMPILRRSDFSANQPEEIFPKTLVERIKFKAPYPVIRAHFGLPSLENTYKGIEKLANAKILDIISIAPDQTAQEWLQKPENLRKQSTGAGGVPIRNKKHLTELHKRSQTGNYPLLRIYSGTQDLIENGKQFFETINNAWAAIPIFWYSELDGRGPHCLEKAINEHFQAIKWHGDHNIPVEINDPHQWGLRMAPDHLVVADAYISALIAKKLGVKIYIEQCMFNTPAGNSFKMDLARVLAMIQIVEPISDNNFQVLRETRAGLTYFAPVDEIAMGQLAASTLFQMTVKPHIMHIVSYCEATHAAYPDDIIKSCKLVQRIIQDSYNGLPDYSSDPEIIAYKEELLEEAQIFIDTIINYGKTLGYEDPLLSPKFLALIVKKGILDAPQLRGNEAAQGLIKTRIIKGKTIVVNQYNSQITEIERLKLFEIPLPEKYQLDHLSNFGTKKVKGGQLE
jgi:hypothetical protein